MGGGNGSGNGNGSGSGSGNGNGNGNVCDEDALAGSLRTGELSSANEEGGRATLQGRG